MNRLLIIVMLLIVSCSPGHVHDTLDMAQSRMEDQPDSVLTRLESIKMPSFSSRGLKARYALLYSIALDKNFIDLTTDSIIAPAVRYYEHNGTPDDRFKTLYYLGRINQNAGDNETALECFCKAADLAPDVSDTLALARCYSAQAVLHADFYDYENAIEANRIAADMFLAAGNVNSYANRVLQESFCWWALNETDSMKVCLDKVEAYKTSIKTSTRSAYYSRKINYLKDCCLADELRNTLNEYIADVPAEYVNWDVVSSVHMFNKDIDKAEEAIRNHMMYGSVSEEEQYAFKARIYEIKGLYKESLDAYRAFVEISDAAYQETFVKNIRLLKDRHEKEVIILKARNRNLILIIVLVIAVISLAISFLSVLRQVRKSKVLKELYSDAEQEKASLELMLKSSIIADAEIRQILSERMELLNDIVLSHRLPRSGKSDRSKKRMENLLSNTKEYLSTIGMTYVVKNPEVVSSLKAKGLTTWEIGYCCLYVMGYSAKEISGIMLNNQVYKISSRIREKLGLEGGKIRFETYLKTLFAQYAGTDSAT